MERERKREREREREEKRERERNRWERGERTERRDAGGRREEEKEEEEEEAAVPKKNKNPTLRMWGKTNMPALLIQGVAIRSEVPLGRQMFLN